MDGRVMFSIMVDSHCQVKHSHMFTHVAPPPARPSHAKITSDPPGAQRGSGFTRRERAARVPVLAARGGHTNEPRRFACVATVNIRGFRHWV